MPILNIATTDFESSLIRITFNVHSEPDLQEYIDKYTSEYLQDLLGKELYDLFVTDLVSGVPQSAEYLAIYNAFFQDDTVCIGQRRSEGMLTMLRKFIFWEYVRNQKVKNTGTGNVVSSNEASREAEFAESRLYTTYNEAIKSYDSIQWYICQNLNTYPKFNGTIKRKTSWL